MWTRAEIKGNAKGFLKKYYLKALIVSLILAFFTTSMGNNGANTQQPLPGDVTPPQTQIEDITIPKDITQIPDTAKEIQEGVANNSFIRGFFDSIIKLPIKIIRFTSPIIMLLVAIILSTLGYSIEVGAARFFLNGYKEEPKIGTVFSAINLKEWPNITLTSLLKNLYIFLWTLLFIIPGIIKSIEYSMTPYILAEDSSLTPTQVINRSKELTYGSKWDIFVLGLSFIGWDILGTLFFGIGYIFIRPYKEATYASLYNKLSKKDEEVIVTEVIEG